MSGACFYVILGALIFASCCSSAVVSTISIGIFSDTLCQTPPVFVAALLNNATLCQTISVGSATYNARVACAAGLVAYQFCQDSACAICQQITPAGNLQGMCGGDVTGLGKGLVYFCSSGVVSDQYCQQQQE